MLVVFVFSYGLPYFSQQFKERAAKSHDIVTRFNLLNKAAFLGPLDPTIHYLKAAALLGYFKETANVEAFDSALDSIKKAQQLNPWFISTYWLESDCYSHLLQKNWVYTGLADEITTPLAAAAAYDPMNPFLQLRLARIYLRFGRTQEARQAALKALELEPNYVGALFFMQRNFHYFPDEDAFKQRLEKLREKANAYQPEPGMPETYLSRLFKFPVQE